MNTNAAASPSPLVPRPINPRFKDRLPTIMNQICESLVVIEPAIDQLNVQLREFLDYLDFEIQKVDLEVKQMKWESKVDIAAVKAAESWLDELRQLKKDFNVEIMTAPPTIVRAMLDRVSKLFGV